MKPRHPARFISFHHLGNMISRNSVLRMTSKSALIGLVLLAQALGRIVIGQEAPVPTKAAAIEESAFKDGVQPLLQKFCHRCHNAENMESGIRVDQLAATPDDRQVFLWKDILKQVADGAMPPADEPQPTAEQRKLLTEWITRAMTAARSRKLPNNGSARRLTVSQYKNTLQDLLGIGENLTDVLPPDGMSKEGFTNSGQTMVLSPLQVEAYFDIAEKALDIAIVDDSKKPVIQNFRMDFGASINPQPCPDNLVLGANSFLLNNPDFVVTELKPEKPFAYQPFSMQTKFEFIEGYVGNDTIRAWKKFDSIYHSVFACMRGTPGYPKGEAHQVVTEGLLLRPAIPSAEIFGQSNTYGPMANFKISLRELPDQGNFRITIKAARYADALLLDSGAPLPDAADTESTTAVELSAAPNPELTVKAEGIYQVDVYCAPGKTQGLLSLTIGERHFSGTLLEPTPKPAISENEAKAADQPTPFMLVRLPAGTEKVQARYGDNSRLRRLVFTRWKESSQSAQRFKTFEQRSPSLGVYLGLRRDCGSTLTPVGSPRPVAAGELQDLVFEGAIRNYASPDVEKDNVNYLAGIREIGVRSEFTDGRDMPRLLIRSVEFEGPYYESWPPATHRNIFFESAHSKDLPTYAEEVIGSFASRAFRRPITATEQKALLGVWQRSFADTKDFRQSIKDALLVVLTSPQFLFQIENSRSPEPEDLDSYELASKLSFFLWNTAPDQRLLDLAAKNTLRDSLDAEIERMIHDPRFGQFLNEFGSQWLSLDKFDVVAVDAQRYPRLTRDVKTQLRQEPIHFLRHLIEQNLPLSNLVESDFIVANEVVANYYNLPSHTESGFRFVPVKHENANLGGVLTQAAILTGLSDGRESHPIKRGAWLARKIVAEPPDDPPPNVPKLQEDDGAKLSLRERLERHRNQKGCVKCHAGIDPWGLPFETFDAGGMLKTNPAADGQSTLPDGTKINDLRGLKAYLAKDRIDQVAFSFLKHASCYAAGRSLSYQETVYLQEEGGKLKSNDYRFQDMIRFIIKSDLFLKK